MELGSKRVIPKWLWITVSGVIILIVVALLSWSYFSHKKNQAGIDSTSVTATTSPSLNDKETTSEPGQVATTPGETAKSNQSGSTAPTLTPTTPASTGSDMGNYYLTHDLPDSVKSPKISGAYVFDSDNNGHIDSIGVDFNTFMNTNNTSTKGFSIEGYTISSSDGKWYSNGTYEYPASRASYKGIKIQINEKAAFDTDVTPLVTYKSSLGTQNSLANVGLASGDVASVDNAQPVAISAKAVDVNNKAGIQDGDNVVITFSEPVGIFRDDAPSSMRASDINKSISLSNGHGWLDGSNNFGIFSLSGDKKTITVGLTINNGLPTVAAGDVINFSLSDQQAAIADLSETHNMPEDTYKKQQLVISGNF